MSSSVRRDALPEMQGAGRTIRGDAPMREVLCQGQAPPTPDNVKFFRKGAYNQPGMQFTRGAKFGDRGFPSDKTFGIPNQYTESTATTLAAMKPPSFAPPQPSRGQGQEAREPLGRSMSHGHKLPAKMEHPDYKFGIESVKSESAKSVVNPSETREMSPRFQAGTQINRNYSNWTVDPGQHRFGLQTKKEAVDPTSPTQLVSLQAANARIFTNNDLGSPRVTGCAPSVDKNHTFGLSKPRELDALKATLLHNATITGSGPGDDIGTTTIRSPKLKRLMNETSPRHDPNRTFGVASVRSDKSPPKMRKVADNTNYGDSVTSFEVLTPGGVDQTVFTATLPDEEAAVVFCQRCKLNAPEEVVRRAFHRAGAAPVKVSAFKSALDSLM